MQHFRSPMCTNIHRCIKKGEHYAKYISKGPQSPFDVGSADQSCSLLAALPLTCLRIRRSPTRRFQQHPIKIWTPCRLSGKTRSGVGNITRNSSSTAVCGWQQYMRMLSTTKRTGSGNPLTILSSCPAVPTSILPVYGRSLCRSSSAAAIPTMRKACHLRYRPAGADHGLRIR